MYLIIKIPYNRGKYLGKVVDNIFAGCVGPSALLAGLLCKKSKESGDYFHTIISLQYKNILKLS